MRLWKPKTTKKVFQERGSNQLCLMLPRGWLRWRLKMVYWIWQERYLCQSWDRFKWNQRTRAWLECVPEKMGGDTVIIDNSFQENCYKKKSREMGGGSCGIGTWVTRDLFQMGHITAWGWVWCIKSRKLMMQKRKGIIAEAESLNTREGTRFSAQF